MKELTEGSLKYRICEISFGSVWKNVLRELLALESLWEYFLVQRKI